MWNYHDLLVSSAFSMLSDRELNDFREGDFDRKVEVLVNDGRTRDFAERAAAFEVIDFLEDGSTRMGSFRDGSGNYF